MIDQVIAELAPVVGTTAACTAVGRARATHYRWHRKSPPRPRPAPKPPRPQPRALSEEERQGVLEVLRSERFVDMAPPEAYATLLDEGIYQRLAFRPDALQAELRRRRQPTAFTVYACDDRGERYLGEQRCDHGNRFCRVAGPGGRRPGCDGPVLLTELLGGLAEVQQ